MPVKHNKDYEPPWAEVYQSAPVTTNNFKDTTRIPIFWGPGQLTLDYPNYTPPNLEKWRKLEILNIPQVVRFIFASKSVYQDDEYNDNDDPPPPDPEGECPEFKYEFEYAGWRVILKAEFIGLVEIEVVSSPDPFFAICNYNTNNCYFTKDTVDSTIIVIKNKETLATLYSGTVYGATTYISLFAQRYLAWYYKYSEILGWILGSNFLSSAPAFKDGDRADPEQIPICWVQLPDGNYYSEIPQGAFSNSLGNPEVCPSIFDWFGCNPDPTSPPISPPPPPPSP